MLPTFGFISSSRKCYGMGLLKAAFLIGMLQCVTGMGNTYHVILTEEVVTDDADPSLSSGIFLDCSNCDGNGCDQVCDYYPCPKCHGEGSLILPEACGCDPDVEMCPECTCDRCDGVRIFNRTECCEEDSSEENEHWVRNTNWAKFKPFTLAVIRQAFRSPATYGSEDLTFSDQTCYLASCPDCTGHTGECKIETFTSIKKLPLVHKFVHANYYSDGGCRCGEHASKWQCTRPLRDQQYEKACRVLQDQAFALEAENGPAFEELHDLKTNITNLRNEDYWNFWRTHTPGVDVYSDGSVRKPWCPDCSGAGRICSSDRARARYLPGTLLGVLRNGSESDECGCEAGDMCDECRCPRCDGACTVEPDTLDESSSSDTAAEEENIKCAICLDDVKPEHAERTPCCVKTMHRHCLKRLVETSVENVNTFGGQELRDVAVSRNICPMCRADWDGDARIIPELYRNFVQVLENAELSEEELALQQDE